MNRMTKALGWELVLVGEMMDLRIILDKGNGQKEQAE